MELIYSDVFESVICEGNDESTALNETAMFSFKTKYLYKYIQNEIIIFERGLTGTDLYQLN